MTDLSLALDIGGTKIAFGLVADDSPLEVINSGSLPSQPVDATTADQVKTAVRTALESAPSSIARVGIGAPGVIRVPQGEIVHSGPTMPGWAGTDIRALVAELTTAPVAIHNDVRTWAYGEHRLGVGQAFPTGRVLYISLGTGVGGAIVEDGALVTGPTGSAGEISELVCADFRGRADRVENIASGTALARYYNRLRANPDLDKIGWDAPRAGDVALPQIVEKLNDGDDLARTIIDGNLYGLGCCLGALTTAWDLSAIVVGGGVSGLGELVLDPIRRGVLDTALAPNHGVAIRQSSVLQHAPLLGAAALARDYAS